MKNIDIIEKTETYAVGACAAVATFSLSADNRAVSIFSAFLPFLIALFGWIRCDALDKTVKIQNNYIQKVIETRFPDVGFTKYYRDNNRGDLAYSRHNLWYILFWVTFLFAFATLIFG